MPRRPIETREAPKAIGAYSQAAVAGSTVYLSGQIPIDPATGKLVEADIDGQLDRILLNLAAVAKAAGGSLDDVVKLGVFLRDLANFPRVNEAIERHLQAPYPARAVVGVSALPLDVAVEIDAILVLPKP